MNKLLINKENKQIDASETDLSGSKFHMAMLNNWDLNDVAMTNCKIVNANLSDLTIEGAQIGGAHISNIGVPPIGHPAYDADFKQRPVTFENCDLNASTITNCNLSEVEITDCNLTGMTINGIPVEDLFDAYQDANGI